MNIKFRAFHCESKTMYSWDDLINRIGLSESVFVETEQWKPMQFTGSKNKKGKEFYEGDVVKNDTGDMGVVRFGKLPLDKSGDCVCTYLAFYIYWFGQLGQAPTYECSEIGEWMEIIGTIHTTHPELLEKSK